VRAQAATPTADAAPECERDGGSAASRRLRLSSFGRASCAPFFLHIPTRKIHRAAWRYKNARNAFRCSQVEFVASCVCPVLFSSGTSSPLQWRLDEKLPKDSTSSSKSGFSRKSQPARIFRKQSARKV